MKHLVVGIMCHSGIGGSSKIAIDLALELDALNNECHVFTLNYPKHAENLGLNKGEVSFHSLNSSSQIELQQNLYYQWHETQLKAYTDLVISQIRKSKINVLHFHYALPFAFISLRIKSILKDECPLLVGTLHGTDVSHHYNARLFGKSLSEALNKQDIITTVSEAYRDLARIRLKLTKDVVVIPNFINLSFIKNNSARKFDATPKRLIHISNFRKVKNTLFVIRIFNEIVKNLDSELIFIGDGPETPAALNLVNSLGLDEHVHFKGYRSNVYDYLNHSDLLIISSKSESFCQVILEAMACGVPTVASRVGGIPELIENELNGILYCGSNPLEVANTCIRLLRNDSLLKHMREHNIKKSQGYSHVKIVSKYIELYTSQQSVSALGNGRSPPPSKEDAL